MKKNRCCVLLNNKKYARNAYDVLCRCGGVGWIVDKAHIFSRSSYPKLREEDKNIICLSRLFHERLDAGRHPITGEYKGSEWSLKFMLSLLTQEDRDYLLGLVEYA